MTDTNTRQVGRHLIADLDGLEAALLRDCSGLSGILREALLSENFRILDESIQVFPGGGFTTVFVLAESHASLHSYPERGYLAFDLFSCGPRNPLAVLDALKRSLGVSQVTSHIIPRYAAR